ncbi:hypothetical protein DFR52_103421 [Hoeflea marina]|uniref:Glycosyltransferase 2-like domain-containing protein n=1 Tax=Hoeflea marina TaxID=274592 RepID=A0A317PHW8_9HYPH|nr:glycosyltransferase [Hoeflea marina]PWW00219.1 hypothetical protein DFR52_103421 [Hoeflea marina]
MATPREATAPQAKFDRTCLLILGMHRSGTSALTRVLSLMGAGLPQHVMGASDGNDSGHWEPTLLAAQDDAILAEYGSAWHDWRPLQLSAVSADRLEQMAQVIGALVNSEYPDTGLFVLKDPRICRMAPLYLQALKGIGVNVAPVLIFRNPLEVIASLAKRRSNWPASHGKADAALLWLVHVLEAEHHSRGMPRAILSYSDLLADWAGAIDGIRAGLDLAFPTSTEEAAPLVDDFLAADLRHQRESPGNVALDPQLRGWVSDTYDALRMLARTPTSARAMAILDQVRAEFIRAEPILSALLSAANSARSDALAAAEAARCDAEAERNRLNALITESNSSRVAAESSLNQWSTEAESARQQLARQDAAHQRIIEERDSLAEALEDERNNAERHIADFDAYKAAAEAKLDQLSAEAHAARAEIAELESSILRLAEERKHLAEALTAVRLEADEHAHETGVALDHVRQLGEAERKASSERDRVSAQLEAEMRIADQARQALEETRGLADSRLAALESSEAIIARARAVLGTYEGDNRDLADLIEAQIQALASSEAELQSALVARNDSIERARQAEATCAVLRAELEAGEMAIEPWRQRLREASELAMAAIADQERAATRQAIELSELEARLQEEHAKLERAMTGAEAAGQRLQEADELNAKLAADLSEAEARVEELNLRIDELRRTQAAEAEEDTRQALRLAEGEISSLADRLMQMQDAFAGENDRMARLLRDYEDREHAANAEVARLRDAYHRSTSWRLTAPVRAVKLAALAAYRGLYKSGGLVLRTLAPDAAVNRIRGLVPDPDGIPRKLGYRPPALASYPAATIAEGEGGRPDVFVLSIIDWDFRTQRPQHIARLLSEKHRVFYVEMMLEMEGMRIRQLDEHLYVVRLGRNAIGHIQPYVGQPEGEQLRGWISSFLEFADHFDATPFKQVIIQHPFWWQMARHLPQDFRIVFDCMDDIAGFSNTTEWLLETERSLLAGCDSLIVSSDYLFNKYAPIKPPTLIRNGGDLTHFEPNDSNAEAPGFLARNGFSKRSGVIAVGYVGAIAEWFDVDLVRTVANRNPDMEFHLCGAVTAPQAAGLDALANVTLYGEIAYAEVPAFIRQMDVMVIPFQLLPIIQACDPVKFYEYSAMGKPTVATELPELNRARELMFLSTGAAEFAANIRKAQRQGRSQEFRDSLRAYAAANTWRHRSELFEQVLSDLPKVSVVVLNYGEPEWTVNTLHSLFSGGPTYPNMEVLLVDNGSSEERLAVLREAVGRAPPQAVRLIENGENLGFARGNNVGIAEATGDYVLLLNNDTFVPPGAIAAMVAHLEANPSIGVVGPMTNNIGNEARVEIDYADMAEMMRRARDLVIGYRGRHSEMPVAAYFAAMLRRDDFEQFGLLSEEYGLGMFEDDDHCAVIRSKGYICALAEDAFVHHHLSASFDAIGAERKQKLFEKNKKIFEAKWGKWVPHRYRKERPASGLGGR